MSGGDLTDAARVRLIRQALEDCGQEATDEAIERQFRYETGRPWKLEKGLDDRCPEAYIGGMTKKTKTPKLTEAQKATLLDRLAFVLEGLDALDRAEAGALLELPAVEDLERLEGDLALSA